MSGSWSGTSAAARLDGAIAGAIAIAIAIVITSVCPLAAQPDPQESLPPKPVDPARLIGAPLGPPVSGEALDQSTEELSSRMRCPVCQALSVADSPSLSAIAIKEEVRGLLAAGYTEDQVIDYFEQAYGEFIRLAPKPEGFNLVVWLAPAVAFLIGAGLVVARLRRSGAAPAGVGAAGASPNEDLSSYLEQVREDVGGGI